MQDRSELIRLAIAYVAGRNENTPPQVRRVLSQKFGADVPEIEIESVCRQIAGHAVLELARLTAKAA